MAGGVCSWPRILSSPPAGAWRPATRSSTAPPSGSPLLDLFGRAIRIPPDRTVLVSGRSAWSEASLGEAVEARARDLVGQLRPGGVHPLTVHPDPSGITDLLAVWRAGGIVAPLSPQLTGPERSLALRALEDAERRAEGLPQGTAAVIWTSGTAGTPRGVAITEANLLANAEACAERLQLSREDVWYAALSLAHIGGLALVARAVLLGATLVAEGPFDVHGLMSALRGDGGTPPVTHTSLVPTQLVRLLDGWGPAPAPATLRCILVGGAATPAPLLERALEGGWPLALTYGMTEMSSQVATATPAQVREKPGSVGAPLPGVEVRVAGDGEILARGRTQAAGFVGVGEPLTDADGWYHSGDLGRVDEDGHLQVVGRKSDRIMSGGVTVDPHEVEAALREHPAIRDACVVGLPDQEWGERVAAVVVPSGGGLDQERIEEWADERLGAARLPRLWLVRNHLPTNRNGKVDRAAVRDLFQASA